MNLSHSRVLALAAGASLFAFFAASGLAAADTTRGR